VVELKRGDHVIQSLTSTHTGFFFLALYQDLGGMFLEGKVWRDGERKRGMEGRKGGGYNGGKSGAVDRG